MKRYLIILILTFAYVTTQAQSFKPLSNATGYNYTPAELTQLEEAADSLVAALPSDFQSDFKVFDAGFYLLNEKMQGGYPAVFEKFVTLAAAQSKYYLLVGRGVDVDGQWRFYCKVKLPDTGKFSCKETSYYELLNYEISLNTQSRADLGFFQAILLTIKELETKIIDITECCDKREFCDQCLSEQQVNAFFSMNDFHIADYKFGGYDTTAAEPEIKDYANMKIIGKDGTIIDWKDDFNFLTTETIFWDRSRTEVYLTSNFCGPSGSGIFETTRQDFEKSTGKFCMWIHFQRVDSINVVVSFKLKNEYSKNITPHFNLQIRKKSDKVLLANSIYDVETIKSNINVIFENNFPFLWNQNNINENEFANLPIDLFWDEKDADLSKDGLGNTKMKSYNSFERCFVSAFQSYYLLFGPTNYLYNNPKYKSDLSKSEVLNKLLAYNLAHELTHQAIQKSMELIRVAGDVAEN